MLFFVYNVRRGSRFYKFFLLGYFCIYLVGIGLFGSNWSFFKERDKYELVKLKGRRLIFFFLLFDFGLLLVFWIVYIVFV